MRRRRIPGQGVGAFSGSGRTGGQKLRQREFAGTLVSDFYGTYVRPGCRHAYCGAHNLRYLTFQAQVMEQEWARELILLIQQMVSAVHRAVARGATRVWNARALCVRYDRLIQEGQRQNPPPVKGAASEACKLLQRPARHKEGCLRFQFDLSVPFTNNEAERDLRMLKVKLKISGCFRTREGADRFCRLRSYIATCRKQGISILQAISSLFQGQILIPQF